MDPSRKRTIRLVVALSAAVVLASALIYTSFSASSEARTPSELATATVGQTYQLTGKVVPGSIKDVDGGKSFRVMDRDGSGQQVAVTYRGAIPDPFRDGREIIIDVQRTSAGGGFTGVKDTLVTKCPSKFTEKNQTT
ncbi:cytochrome c maturation protein CcmE [Conexibacter sp. SYSU D00693]|uniref:cytochrome c maturation protein CcmE n=1 Tax=Conexibacter sp. SYSU D00693 TaxID=2812560 RepID=UPI00196A8E0F|nr:cytochrome c maturation protein CcmE [Conexibacter sp. SYSU D00693]